LCFPRVKLAQYRSRDPISTVRDVRWNGESAGEEGVKRGSVCCLVSPRVTAIRNNPLLGFILSASLGGGSGAENSPRYSIKPGNRSQSAMSANRYFLVQRLWRPLCCTPATKGIAGRILVHNTSVVTCSCSPRCHTSSATMTLTSTSGSSSVFEDGKLKPGIYKIQNIHTDTYLDIEVSTREVCCRPAKDLGKGRGLVRWYLSSVIHVSDG
jgi:hypothetical protein